jgi:hypothetical protein
VTANVLPSQPYLDDGWQVRCVLEDIAAEMGRFAESLRVLAPDHPRDADVAECCRRIVTDRLEPLKRVRRDDLEPDPELLAQLLRGPEEGE